MLFIIITLVPEQNTMYKQRYLTLTSVMCIHKIMVLDNRLPLAINSMC